MLPPTRSGLRARARRDRRRGVVLAAGAVLLGGALVISIILPHDSEEASFAAESAPRAAASSASSSSSVPTLSADARAIAEAAADIAPTATIENLRTAAETTQDAPAATASVITPAITALVDDVTSGVTVVLGQYSDASHTTEAALAASVAGLASVAPADLAARLQDVSTHIAAVKQDALAYRAHLAASVVGTSTQPAGGDVAAQLTYLNTYAYTYNSVQWGDGNSSGGDCVNFTSQGLLARGWKMDASWFSDGDPGAASSAWIYAPAMAAYLDSMGITYSTQDDLDRVRVGDVGVFSWSGDGTFDHVMTVSRVDYTDSGPVIYFVSHNDDGTDRELMQTITVLHPGSSVRIYHIP